MKLETQYLLSTTAGVYVKWTAPKSGMCRIQADFNITWPSLLVLDVKTSIASVGPQYPAGFTSLQLSASSPICLPFYVQEGMEIWVLVNTISATSAEAKVTPSIE